MKKTKCEHKNIEKFDGIQEGYKTKFYFCSDCDTELEAEIFIEEDESYENKN